MREKAPIPMEEIEHNRPKNPTEVEEDYNESLSEAEQLNRNKV